MPWNDYLKGSQFSQYNPYNGYDYDLSPDWLYPNNPIYSLLPKDWRKKVIWNKDWVARDTKAAPIPSGSQSSYSRGFNDTKSGSLNLGKNLYSFDRNGQDITFEEWYQDHIGDYFDGDVLTDQGKDWFRQYYENSKSNNPKSFFKQIEDYINGGFKRWTPIRIDKNTMFSSPKQFVQHYTNDRKIGEAYNVNSGVYNYFINKNGKIEGLDNTTGWEEYGTDDDISSTLNDKYKDITFKRWKMPSVTNKIKPDVSLPNVSDVTSPENLSKIDTRLQQVGSVINGEGQREVGGDKGKKVNPDGSSNGGNRGPFNPTILDAMRLAADNLFNIRNTNAYKRALRPSLENHSPNYKQVFGDEKAKQQGRQQAARLINRTPLTSNAQLQTASDLEAIAKGNQYIQQGENKDAETYWKTSELAFQQAKENTNAWQNVANRNYKSLTDYSNKLAELDYQANKDNMQNIDKFVAEQSKRLWDKYDLYEYKKMAAEEKANDLYDKYYGNSGEDLIAQELTTKYTDLSDQIYKTTDPAEKQRLQDQQKALQQQMRMLSSKKEAQQYINYLRRYNPDNWSNTWNSVYGNKFTVDNNNVINGFKSEYAQKLREQGIDVDKLLNLFGWISPQQGNEIDGRRAKDGMKFQSGGSFGVSYTSAAGGGNPYLQALLGKGSTSSKKKADYSSSDSSSTKDDDNSKQKDKLLSEIANTLKGIDGLDSDVEILYKELDRFFDIQQYNLNDDPMQFYSTYIKMLNRVNQIKQSAKQFQKSFDQLEKDKALNSPAITNGGKVVVGIANSLEMDVVSVEDYLANRNKYHLLTNGEYLELRRKKPFMAFDDTYLTQITQNGTSLEAIEKYLKEFISGLGRDEESRDVLTRRVGTEGMQGLETLKGLIQGKFTDAETAEIAAALNSLGEYNVSVSSQARQIQLALNSIFAFMPPNMRTLLELYCGGQENSEKAVLGLITKNTNAKLDFKINGFTSLDETGQLKSGSTKSGSGSGSGSSDKEPQKDQTLVAIIRAMGGTPDRIKLNEGTKSEMSIDCLNYQIEGAYDSKSLRSALSDTKIMGISDPRKIYFGDQLLQSEVLDDVAYLGKGFSRVMFPITQDGSPDFTILSRFESACDKLRSSGIDPIVAMSSKGSAEDKKKFAEAMQSEDLYSLLDQRGLPNPSKFGLFLLTEGLTSSRAGIKQSTYVVQDDDSSSMLESILTKTNQNTGKVLNEYELDKYSMFNPFDWGSNYEKVFKGTIYIPINNNELQADIASGNKLSDPTATSYQQEYQSSTKRLNFKDRE